MSVDSGRISVRAAAKINLFLEVLGERPNGYHDLRSVVVPISLFDTIEIENTPGSVRTELEDTGVVSGSDLVLLPQDRNLATRAALALQKATGHRGGARIRLKKQIPIGGGLGGGSANAAAVLTGLNRFWGSGLSKDELMRIGAGLGCDLPALIHGGAVLMEGLGDRVSGIPGVAREGASWWLVLVNPGFRVSTKDIYSRCKTALTSGDKTIDCIVSALRNGDVEQGGRSLFNGLEAPVFRKYPLIQMIAEELEKAGSLGVLLCGSGASVFGLARNERHARSLAACIRKTLGFPVWSRVARTLPDGVMAAHGPLEA